MSEADRSRVEDAVRRLLADNPLGTTSPEDFWGAQYDAGLAWVQFPVGRGGLGVDPRLQSVVDDALRAAGAAGRSPRRVAGHQRRVDAQREWQS